MGSSWNGLLPLHLETRIYRKDNHHQLKFEDFCLPFGGELSGENRWLVPADADSLAADRTELQRAFQ
jgi:hypothetical protein